MRVAGSSRATILVFLAVASIRCSHDEQGKAASDAGTDAAAGKSNSGGSNNDGASGTGGVANSGGASGSSGASQTGGTGGVRDAGTDASLARDASADGPLDATQKETGTSYVNMAPPLLDPIPRTTAGIWEYHQISGALCRDGSPAGFYTRFSDVSKSLVIYLEQGGACFHPLLCSLNPASVSDSITGRDLPSVQVHPGVMQAPTTTGIFDFTNSLNPYRDWNMVWVPYCTGDVHAGSAHDVTIPGVSGTQQFVGYENMKLFVGHIVPTFADADRVVLMGTSAGSFGAGMNFNQVQDAFGTIPVTLVMDSGVPLSDTYMTPCLQTKWRQYWNIGAALPPECTECTGSDGGGLTNLFTFSSRKYPNVKAAIISSVNDQIMSFIFGTGLNNCELFNPDAGPQDAGLLPIAQSEYALGLQELRTMALQQPGRLGTYYIPGYVHMYSQFDDFYQPLSGGIPLVTFIDDVLAGNVSQVGP